MATNTGPNPEEKPEGQEQSASRRVLIRAGWAIPVVLAAMTPANVFATGSPVGSDGSLTSIQNPPPGRKKASNAAASPFPVLDREIRNLTR